jgi:hypothetical protein
MSKRVKLTVESDTDTTDISDSDYVEESSDSESDFDIVDIVEPEHSGITFNIGDIHINLDRLLEEDDEDEDDEEEPNIIVVPNIRTNPIDDFKLNMGTVNNLKDLIAVLDHIEATDAQKELLSVCRELDSLIGMTDLKNKITTLIVSIIQGLVQKDTLLNTILTGSPGTGKTSVIHIIARIYKSLGYLSSDKITVANKASLIGGFLGQTVGKTTAVLNSAIGGVLVIDEVYSLYSAKEGSHDMYGQECIDTINQFLSEHPELICIVAGYADDIENCFLKINAGLSRRFPWRFSINNYTSDELCDIFYNQLSNDMTNKWTLSVNKEFIRDLIKKNFSGLKNNGGDMKELLDKSKLLYARRAFNEKLKTFVINNEDLTAAMSTLVLMKNNSSDDCGFCKDLAKAVKETRDCKNCNKSLRSYIS